MYLYPKMDLGFDDYSILTDTEIMHTLSLQIICIHIRAPSLLRYIESAIYQKK